MTLVSGRGGLILAGILLSAGADGRPSAARGNPEAVEAAVMAVSAEMTMAAEAMDADRLFSYMLDTDKGSVIQNGLFLATRQEALERVRTNLRGLSRIRYEWQRQDVTVVSPDAAVLAAEGNVTATTAAGVTFSRPFAQTVVFVRRAGGWKAIHAHQSSPPAP